MSPQANKAVVTRFLNHIEQGDADAAMALAAEDATFWHPMTGDQTKAQMHGVLKQMRPMMPTFEQTLSSMTAEDDRVSVELQVRATTAGGKSYQNRYHFMFGLRDGVIVSSREYVDTVPVREAFFG